MFGGDVVGKGADFDNTKKRAQRLKYLTVYTHTHTHTRARARAPKENLPKQTAQTSNRTTNIAPYIIDKDEHTVV